MARIVVASTVQACFWNVVHLVVLLLDLVSTFLTQISLNIAVVFVLEKVTILKWYWIQKDAGKKSKEKHKVFVNEKWPLELIEGSQYGSVTLCSEKASME